MDPAATRGVWTDLRGRGSILLGASVAGTLLMFTSIDAGFPKTLWMPVAMFFVGLAAVAASSIPELLTRVPRVTLVAVVALYAYAAWCFLSITWADAPADAWDAANRTLLYATLYAVVAVWPWRPGVAAATLLAFSVGVAMIGAATLRAGVRAGDVTAYFLDGVLSEPSGYHNANAALFLIAFWPALLFAARAETPFAIRPLLLATACALLELAMLSQSRGSLIALPVSAAVVVVFFPGRLRWIVALVPVALGAVLARGPLFEVFAAVRRGDGSGAVRDAAVAFALSVVGVGVAGIILALVDRRLSVSPRLHRAAGRTVLATAAAAIVVVGALALATDPVARARVAWDDFKQYRPEQQAQANTHFGTGLGSNRYDFWRVAVLEFQAEPLHGIGADNFAVPYLRERQSDEEPFYPHSLLLGILSQTGLVGAALFAVFAAAAAAAASRARAAGPRTATLAAAGVGAATYFGVHAAGEWLWELPAVGGAALVALALPAGAARADLGRGAGRAPALAIVALGATASVAVASLALPWLSVRLTNEAARSWRADPQYAHARLDDARALNPLSERPDLVASAIASREGDWMRMRRAAQSAVGRKPRSWYGELQLAVVDAVQGRRESARAHLDRAASLNPREPAIALVRRRLAAGEEVRPAEIDELFLRRVADRNG